MLSFLPGVHWWEPQLERGSLKGVLKSICPSVSVIGSLEGPGGGSGVTHSPLAAGWMSPWSTSGRWGCAGYATACQRRWIFWLQHALLVCFTNCDSGSMTYALWLFILLPQTRKGALLALCSSEQTSWPPWSKDRANKTLWKLSGWHQH